MLLPRWFTDTAEAAQHPKKAAALAGVLAAVCWAFLAYFWIGPHNVAGAAAFAGLIGLACFYGTTRGLREYRSDPSRSARIDRARRAGFRLGAMWIVFGLFVVIALAIQSLAVLTVGVVMFIVTGLVLRSRGR